MMNRILTQILAAMMALNLAACGQPEMNNNAPENAEAVVEEIDIEEAKDMAAATLPGGWQKADSPEITDEIREIIEKALDGMVGARYIPVAYLGSQLVAGRNYAIFCRIAPVVPDAKETFAIVYIYQDLDGNARVNDVMNFDVETNISEMFGGWRQAEDPQITEELNEVFEKAMEGLLGVNYIPVALISEQVVNGKNYCFLSEATVVYPGAEAGYSLVYINVDAEGNVSLNEIVALNAAEAAEE